MSDAQHTIIQQLLQVAPYDGWTDAALERAAEQVGFEASYAYIPFPGGIDDAVKAYIAQLDEQMIADLHKQKLTKMRIRDRIATAVMTRIELMAPHKPAIRALSGYLTKPENTALAMRTLFNTASLMWYEAGDTSADFNYYSKRTLLSGVYSSTLLFWLQDESDDMTETRAFLDRRIGDVMQIEKAKFKLKELWGKLAA